MSSTRAYAVAALLAVADVGRAADTAPTVFLNHFYVVVDADTYSAVQASPFLTGELAPFEKRTTQRNDTSYTGLYWYGRRTYFELFEPGAQGPVGASGLALGVEAPGGSAAVEQAWRKAMGAAGHGPITRKTETGEVPWFGMTYGRVIPGLRVFLMEYDREFLARWYGALTKARSITRADVLDRYVAKVGRQREGALLEDVTGLTIALAPESREALVKQLLAVGWPSRAEGTSVVCAGPESVELHLIEPAGGLSGITEVRFSLRRAVEAATHKLGAAELRLDGQAARLRLRQAR